MITIDQVMAYIDDDYKLTRTELLILMDIVRDRKFTINEKQFQCKCNGIRSKHKDVDYLSIMELLNYKVKINPEDLKDLTDKKRLIINNNRNKRIYKQRFTYSSSPMLFDKDYDELRKHIY